MQGGGLADGTEFLFLK